MKLVQHYNHSFFLSPRTGVEPAFTHQYREYLRTCVYSCIQPSAVRDTVVPHCWIFLISHFPVLLQGDFTIRLPGDVVGVTGLEPATLWSQTRCATNCATPRIIFIYPVLCKVSHSALSSCSLNFCTWKWFQGASYVSSPVFHLKLSELSNLPSLINYFVLVAGRRIELLFPEWKSDVLTVIRTRH